MSGRSIRLLTALAVFSLVSGCVQATRHSNTMIFGTNTTFGIKAGTTTAQVPEVIVGYERQEAVIMPLLANTVEATLDASDVRNRLSPCRVEQPVEVQGGEYAVHPCSFVSIKGGNLDSYSVLASFGAKFGARATNPEATGGLAQYFATGMAAQILADRGGAALVSTDDDAANTGGPPRANQNLFPATTPFAVGAGKAFDDAMVELRKVIREAPSPAARRQKMRGLFDNLQPQLPASLVNGVLQQCDVSADACVTAVNQNQAVLLSGDNFSQAVAAWKDY